VSGTLVGRGEDQPEVLPDGRTSTDTITEVRAATEPEGRLLVEVHVWTDGADGLPVEEAGGLPVDKADETSANIGLFAKILRWGRKAFKVVVKVFIGESSTDQPDGAIKIPVNRVEEGLKISSNHPEEVSEELSSDLNIPEGLDLDPLLVCALSSGLVLIYFGYRFFVNLGLKKTDK